MSAYSHTRDATARYPLHAKPQQRRVGGGDTADHHPRVPVGLREPVRASAPSVMPVATKADGAPSSSSVGGSSGSISNGDYDDDKDKLGKGVSGGGTSSSSSLSSSAAAAGGVPRLLDADATRDAVAQLLLSVNDVAVHEAIDALPMRALLFEALVSGRPCMYAVSVMRVCDLPGPGDGCWDRYPQVWNSGTAGCPAARDVLAAEEYEEFTPCPACPVSALTVDECADRLRVLLRSTIADRGRDPRGGWLAKRLEWSRCNSPVARRWLARFATEHPLLVGQGTPRPDTARPRLLGALPALPCEHSDVRAIATFSIPGMCLMHSAVRCCRDLPPSTLLFKVDGPGVRSGTKHTLYVNPFKSGDGGDDDDHDDDHGTCRERSHYLTSATCCCYAMARDLPMLHSAAWSALLLLKARIIATRSPRVAAASIAASGHRVVPYTELEHLIVKARMDPAAAAIAMTAPSSTTTATTTPTPTATVPTTVTPTATATAPTTVTPTATATATAPTTVTVAATATTTSCTEGPAVEPIATPGGRRRRGRCGTSRQGPGLPDGAPPVAASRDPCQRPRQPAAPSRHMQPQRNAPPGPESSATTAAPVSPPARVSPPAATRPHRNDAQRTARRRPGRASRRRHAEAPLPAHSDDRATPSDAAVDSAATLTTTTLAAAATTTTATTTTSTSIATATATTTTTTTTSIAVAAADEHRGAPPPPSGAESGDGVCVVCMEARSCVLLLPCAHMCLCDRCAPLLRQCPVCRVAVQQRIRAYIV